MKIYRVVQGIVIEHNGHFYLLENENWDCYINDDALYQKSIDIIKMNDPDPNAHQFIKNDLLPPIQSQEVWASGVTYYRSKQGREEESKASGGAQFYAHVYEAPRPELFFKAAPHRVVGSGQKVRIRKDSTWDVPEPELTLMLGSSGKILGYTVGNDMSSRSIEGENPLYLPQAKTYDKSAAIGPCILVAEDPLPRNTRISLRINREQSEIFFGDIEISQIKRKFTELASWLFRECTFPHGCLLMTGTGIVPSNEITLKSGDEIIITIDTIGTLKNMVE